MSVLRSPVRMGVLGCASIAWRRTLPAMADVAELVAVASRDRARAETFAAKFGCEAVQGYDRLLARDDIEAVYVPLPTGLHGEWAVRALEAGKHTLVEKPLVTNLKETMHLVDLAREKGLLLRENFTFLHHAQHAAVSDLVGEGRIGEIRVFNAVFGIPPLPADNVRYQAALGGGALLDLGVYPIRAAQHFLLGELEVVGAALHDDPITGVDVAGSALLRSDTGVTAQLNFGFEHHYRNTYDLWGSRGRIVVERAFTPSSTLQPVIRIEQQGRVEELSLPPDDQFRNVLVAFTCDIGAGTGVDDVEALGSVNSGTAMLRQAALVDAVRVAVRHGALKE